jgi:hypothetical protein
MKNIIFLTIGLLSITANAQRAWYPVNSLNNTVHQITNISFVNDQLGHGTTNTNVYYTTNDGGATWHAKKINTPKNLDSIFIDIYFVNEQVGFARSDYNVYQTKNAGLTWTRTFFGTSATFETHKGYFYIYGDAGFGSLYLSKYFVASDSFSYHNGFWPIYSLSKVQWIADSVLLVAKDTGRIYISKDLGQTLKLVYDIDSSVKSNRYIKILSMYFLNKDTGYAHFSNNTVVFTANGGETWQKLSINSGFLYRSKFVQSHGVVYLGVEERANFFTASTIYSINDTTIIRDTSSYISFASQNFNPPNPLLGANSKNVFAYFLESLSTDTIKGESYAVKALNQSLSTSKNRSEKFSIYPNPVHNQLNYSLTSKLVPQLFSIYNLQGSLICSGILAEKQGIISTLQLPVGMYVLKTNNSTLKFQKI